jgi:hypothetical protein
VFPDTPTPLGERAELRQRPRARQGSFFALSSFCKSMCLVGHTARLGLVIAISDSASTLFGASGDVTISQALSSLVERRLVMARTIYQALVAQDPNRAITLRDGVGRVVARHDLHAEQSAPGTRRDA